MHLLQHKAKAFRVRKIYKFKSKHSNIWSYEAFYTHILPSPLTLYSVHIGILASS